MVRTVAALLFTIVAASPAAAQRPFDDRRDPRGGTLNEHNITSTGETVPNPGVSQDAGTTPLDRGIERRDDAIGGTICKGC